MTELVVVRQTIHSEVKLSDVNSFVYFYNVVSIVNQINLKNENSKIKSSGKLQKPHVHSKGSNRQSSHP